MWHYVEDISCYCLVKNFILHLFHKYLLNTHYVLDMVLRDKQLTRINPCSQWVYIWKHVTKYNFEFWVASFPPYLEIFEENEQCYTVGNVHGQKTSVKDKNSIFLVTSDTKINLFIGAWRFSTLKLAKKKKKKEKKLDYIKTKLHE